MSWHMMICTALACTYNANTSLVSSSCALVNTCDAVAGNGVERLMSGVMMPEGERKPMVREVASRELRRDVIA